MPPKRKNSQGETLTAGEMKKKKVAAARTIEVQPVRSSFPNKEPTDSLHWLPNAIDVEKFAEARAFEISAMQSAMKNASASSTSRAWQALPRHLRRRAASHDVRRVPLRLREKARAEMDPVRKKALGRSVPKLGRNKRLKRSEIFLKRQRDKSWLETHLWHAKRMNMMNLWGYRLAVHPTEKGFRPSHRASVHGSILHDASYYSLIELKGPENILKAILEVCCDPQGVGPGARRYTTGVRCLETYIHKPGSYPFDLISPITVVWKPLARPLTPGGDDSGGGQPTSPEEVEQKNFPGRKRKRKGKEQGITIPTLADSVEEPRVIWLRSHPSVFDDVFSSLQTAASLALDTARREGDREITVEIADLRGQINAFEIMGPKSNQVLKGALSPCPQDLQDEFKKFWTSLADWQTSGELAQGLIVGFKVQDPRLKFPPRNARPMDHIPCTIVPSPQLASSEIWDDSVRSSLVKPRFKKKDLDERRSKLLIPGTQLKPLRQDDRIPILLIQRSLKSSFKQGLHGWTLIIPAGWSMAFFNSLTYSGTRVGGQRERQTQAFEAGTAYFPRDLPSSAGYEPYVAAREMEEKARWSLKPPAKRPNFEKLGTRSPWRADWEVVLGLPTQSPTIVQEDFVSTQRDTSVTNKEGVGIWLLRGSEVPEILSNMSKLLNPAAGLFQAINRLRMKRGHDPLGSSIKADELMKAALVSVSIKMCKRGVVSDLAMIYSVQDDEVKKWSKSWHQTQIQGSDLDFDSEEDVQFSSVVPPDSLIIGYVTTGHFSLSQGQGCAIGAISVVKLLELQEQSQRLSPNSTLKQPTAFVKIRHRSSQQCRPAFIELLDG